MTDQTIQNIRLPFIDPPAWDSRLSDPRKDPDWTEFVESMRPGQLQPIVVEGPNEIDGETHYLRVFGGRRFAAAQDLGWATIACIVRPPTDETTRTVDNAVENLDRKNLTSYEMARTFARLREVGMTGEAIGARFGLSKQRVSNLVTPLAKLPAPILEDWKNNVPAVDTNILKTISSLKDDDEKVKVWEARKKEIAARTDTKTGKVKPKKRQVGGGDSVSLKAAHYRTLEEFLRAKSTPATLGKAKVPKKWAYQLMCYLVGANDTPPDGIEFAKDDKS
jgi:ParB/RepB/Spo0J family partition protein